MRPILEYQKELALGEGKFLELYPEPVLVVEPFEVVEGGGIVTKAVSGNAQGVGGTLMVAPLMKRLDANAFGSMITLGRASNNDLHLQADGVSKFHAFFTTDADGTVHVTDANSTYGVLVGEEVLKGSQQKRALTSGMRLKIGCVEMTYYTAQGLFAYLQPS